MVLGLFLQPSYAKASEGTSSPQVRAAGGLPPEARRAKGGGARRNRTADLLNAIQALSQLSYGPLSRPPDWVPARSAETSPGFPRDQASCARQMQMTETT